VGASELIDEREKIVQIPISGDSDNQVHLVEIQENTLINDIIERVLWVDMGGETYTSITSQDITGKINDQALFTGYQASILIGRSKLMNQTITLQYHWVQFMAEVAGAGVFLYAVFQFFMYMLWPVTTLVESRLM
jgi:hypothetical protein